MTTFIGDYQCKVDEKGRIVFPSAFKKQLSKEVCDRFVVKKDIYENCLVLYPMDEWERQVEIIRNKINQYNKDHNRFLRGFYRGTAEILMDTNNRMLFPKRLLDEVGIDKEVVLAGQDSKIEIWAKEKYDGIAETNVDFASLAESILGNYTMNSNSISKK